MSSNDSADVVVVGGGIVGTAGAFYLARRGARVIVCEKGEVGAEQSTRNWGFVRQQGRALPELPLMIESNRIWQGLERELNDDVEWLQHGNFVTFSTEPERAAWGRWVEAARGHGLESRLVEPAEFGKVVPGTRLDAQGALGAVFTPNDGQAEPRRVMPALHRAAEGRGVEFRTGCAVFSIDVEAGAVAGVTTERGVIRAPVVVCAAGVWSSRLLRFLGLRLPQMWLKGSVARTTPVPGFNHTATWSGIGFRQRRDGTMNVSTRSADHDLLIDSVLALPAFRRGYFAHRRGVRLRLGRPFFELFAGRFSAGAFARELVRHRVLDPAPNERVLREVLDQVKHLVPGAAHARIERAWAGYIDMTPDLLPVIDRLDAPSGLVLATGFSGHGFGMGPIAGRLVSELVLDGRASFDLTAFRYSRFHDGTRISPQGVI